MFFWDFLFFVFFHPIAQRANPATVPGMRAPSSIYQGQKLYINLLKILEGCKFQDERYVGDLFSVGLLHH